VSPRLRGGGAPNGGVRQNIIKTPKASRDSISNVALLPRFIEFIPVVLTLLEISAYPTKLK
jgi:hypothetical protein